MFNPSDYNNLLLGGVFLSLFNSFLINYIRSLLEALGNYIASYLWTCVIFEPFDSAYSIIYAYISEKSAGCVYAVNQYNMLKRNMIPIRAHFLRDPWGWPIYVAYHERPVGLVDQNTHTNRDVHIYFLPNLRVMERMRALTYQVNKADYATSFTNIFDRNSRTITMHKDAPLYIPDALYQGIITDARYFYARREFYARMGRIFKRVYLFCGPPGTGKSSMVRHLAMQLKLNVRYQTTAGAGNTLFGYTEEKSFPHIRLFEDIDRWNLEEKEAVAELANIMDGPCSEDGTLYILTCNDKSKLPDVLLRPGRVDKTWDFPLMTKDVLVRICRDYNCQLTDVPHFAEKSMADILQMVEMLGDHEKKA